MEEAVTTTICIMNRAQLQVNIDKTPFKLWKGRPTSIKCFRNFGSKFYMKINDDELGKFDSKVDEGIFIGYSTRNKAYICYNKSIHKVMECIDISHMLQWKNMQSCGMYWYITYAIMK